MRSAIITVLALFLLPVVTRGQEEIHRKIYVPLEEWEQVLEEEPRGLMLTKVEYDDLILRAKANLKQGEVGGPPPVGAAISGATYEATLEGSRCVVDANLEIEFLRDGWVLLPLGLEGTAPADATLGEAKALLRRNRVGGYFLLARGKGKASLRIPFSSAAEESAEGYLIRFGLAPSAAGTFRFRAPGQWEISEAGRSGVVAYDADTGETRFSTPIGGRRRITLHLARRKEGKERRPVILLDKELTLLIDDAAIDAWWDLDYTVLREKKATFEIGLPAGFDLTEVSTPDLLDWRVLQNGNLQITLQNDAEGHVPVTVRMRTGIPAGGEVQTPHLSGVDADRQWGRMQILLLGGQRGRLVRLEGAREIPVGEAAPSNGNEPPVSRHVFRSFAWSGDSPKVTLEVERPPPRLLADVRTLVTVTDEGVWFRTIIGYQAIEGETLSLSPQLPDDLELFSLQAEGATIEWREEEEGRVWVGLSSKLTGQDKVYLMVEGRLPGGEELAIPLIVAGAEREEGYLSFAVEGGYSLRGSEIRGLDPIDARLSTQIMGMDVKGAKLCYRYRDPHYGGKILVREEKPEINLETVEYISLVEDTLKFQIQLGYEFLRAGAREVRFVLPSGTGEIEIQGDGYKEKSRTDEEDGEHWKVTFQAPALGRRHLFVTFEAKLSDVSEIPMLVAIGVERQRGYVAIEASAESEITLRDLTGLREVDPAEVPDHARYKPEQKVLFAYRYVTADRSVGFSAQRHEKGKVHQAVVSSFEADVQCNPWGAEKVTATYTIQQTSMQWLE
ncbi:MAG: hypothetical protein O6952_04535, partial [Planctomycetota bacterium]|nr:hypothetical protein [Planctomycetota bacterium]